MYNNKKYTITLLGRPRGAADRRRRPIIIVYVTHCMFIDCILL